MDNENLLIREQIPHGVVDPEGDVKPAEDYTDSDGYFVGEYVSDETDTDDKVLALARRDYDHAKALQKAWDDFCDRLDNNYPSHDEAYTETERKMGPRPEVPLELRELFEGATGEPVEPAKFSASSIIKASRQRQLEACATDTKRRAELLAQFRAHDARRARGPMA